MLALAGSIGSLIASVWGLILYAAGRKITLAGLYIGFYVAMVTTFILTVNGIIGNLSASQPTDSYVLVGLSLLPANAGQCIGIIMTTYGASWLFLFKHKLLSLSIKAAQS